MRSLILFILIFGSIKTFGCTCDNSKKQLKDLRKKADYVFVGQVISFEALNDTGTKSNVKLRLIEKIKGDVTKEVIVITEFAGSCSVEFVAGQKYLIIASSRYLMYGNDEFESKSINDKSVESEYNWVKELKTQYTVTFSNACSITLKNE